MARQDPQVAVRLPPDVKAFIEREAVENASSKNSEIVRAIRERMKAKQIGMSRSFAAAGANAAAMSNGDGA